jgi:hypothetical protein
MSNWQKILKVSNYEMKNKVVKPGVIFLEQGTHPKYP